MKRERISSIALEAGDPIQTERSARYTSLSRGVSLRGIGIRLFFTCWVVFVMHFATNIVREIYPALSLGDHLTFDVSEYMGLHPDIFEIPGRGAFINNNPGASILGAIPYAIARPVIDAIVETVQRHRVQSSEFGAREYETEHKNSRKFYREAVERGLDVKFVLAAGVIQAFCMAPLSALSVVVMFFVLVNFTRSHRMALALALLYAFATPVFYRTAHLNHNLLLGHFAFFSFVILWRPWDKTSNPRRSHYLLAGLLCGWTVVLDYSGIVALFALGIYALCRGGSLPGEAKPRYGFVHFAVGVMIALGILAAYQWWNFGNPFFPAQHYMPPVKYVDRGYRGLAWPQLDLLWETAFGIRYGLFTSAPLLLLFFYIPGWYRNDSRVVSGLELRCIIIYLVAFFIFCAANQYGRIQFNTGVRHIVPVTPFLFLLVASVFMRMPTIPATLVAIVTTYWSWCLAMYRDVEFGLGIFESPIHISTEGLRLPWLTTLEQMGYVSIPYLPTLVIIVLGVVIWLLWNLGKPQANREQPALVGKSQPV
jgi:hypothetical protein